MITENYLIRKLRFISKFVTLQPGKQTIAIHILHNISRSRGNKTMKFYQLIEYNVRISFFFKKALCEVEANGLHFSFNIFRQHMACTCNKNKLYKTLDC